MPYSTYLNIAADAPTAISRNNIHSNLSVGFPLGNFFVRFNAYALRNGCIGLTFKPDFQLILFDTNFLLDEVTVVCWDGFFMPDSQEYGSRTFDV